jgi:hypothetical protein
MATSTISGDLIHHVREMYLMSLDDALNKRGVRQGINGLAIHGIAAYIIAAASVEAFINEAFLSGFPRSSLRNSSLWNLPSDWLETIELSAKLILVPQMLYGKSFSRDAQPYQDMVLLIKIRNDMIHYKMPTTPPKYVNHLSERGIALVAPSFKENGADYPWPSKLSCSEGIRWANNTASSTVQQLVQFVNTGYRDIIEGIASNFITIPESFALNWYTVHGIDPKSNDPEKTPSAN